MTSSPIGSGRLSSLDGLRGIAALVVVAHHASLLFPEISAAYLDPAHGPVAGSVAWWFTFTPLKLLTAGPEAVIVFFVLSGFVLTLPLLSGRPFDWMAYYPRRIVRIGLPTLCSLLFAAALALLIPQQIDHAMSSWVASTSMPGLTVGRFIQQIDPTFGNYPLNNPLWSIYWEVAFSMMLPLFVGLAIWTRRIWPLVLAAASLAVFFGVVAGAGGFHYLPPFFVGVLAAVILPGIRRVGATISGWRAGWLVWLFVVLISALLLVAHWMVPDGVVSVALVALQPLAALGLLICCLEWRPLAGLLSHQPFRWTGKVSFSLYLVHVPIIVGLSYALSAWGPIRVGLFAVPLALIAAAVFYQLVEKRSHGLSKFFGSRIAAAVRQSAPTAPAAPPAPVENAERLPTSGRG
ncbi:acyltransferase family protein [Leifsonia sp. RAF41]|uniref:acyltransferase family protein n=1 Tax=Leifsonia sp. RAF41 TaxID=3233056 RepID=UPI003F9DE218